MLTWMVVTVVSLLVCITPMAAAEIHPLLLRDLPPAIRALNMRCRTLTSFTPYRRAERGDWFELFCDGDYHYRLFLTLDNKVYITPWSE